MAEKGDFTNMIFFWAIVILAVLAFATGIVVLQGWLFMLAWNILTPWDVTLTQGIVVMLLIDLIGSSFRSRS